MSLYYSKKTLCQYNPSLEFLATYNSLQFYTDVYKLFLFYKSYACMTLYAIVQGYSIVGWFVSVTGPSNQSQPCLALAVCFRYRCDEIQSRRA